MKAAKVFDKILATMILRRHSRRPMIIVLPTKALGDLNNMNEEFNYIRRNVSSTLSFILKYLEVGRFPGVSVFTSRYLLYHELCAMGLPKHCSNTKQCAEFGIRRCFCAM